MSVFNPGDEKVDKASIPRPRSRGRDYGRPRDILELLRKYRKDDRIKGILIRINSPGGVVGPSQEMYEEIKRTRTKNLKNRSSPFVARSRPAALITPPWAPTKSIRLPVA